VDFAGGRKDKLLWDTLNPIKNAGDFGRASLPPVFCPIECLERELDQAGVDGRNPSELFADARDLWAVMRKQHRPGLDHLLQVSLTERIREGVARREKAQCAAGVQGLVHSPHESALGWIFEHLIQDQNLQESGSG
jgi:hypothetical protein